MPQGSPAARSIVLALWVLGGCSQALGLDQDYQSADAIGGGPAGGNGGDTGGSGGGTGGNAGAGQGGGDGGSSMAPIVVTRGPGLAHDFDADAYDGSLGSMECEPLDVMAPPNTQVQRVEVVVGIDSSFVGDMVIKIVSASNKTLSLLSRPGALESADDGTGGTGEGSDLLPSHRLTFADDATYDAEQMGASLDDDGVVCRDDGECDFFPNPGSGPGVNLDDFTGDDPSGTWQVCFADASGSVGGSYDFVELTIVAW